MLEVKGATSVFGAGQKLHDAMQNFADYNDYLVNLMELSRILSQDWNVNYIVYNQHVVPNPIPHPDKLYKIQKTFASIKHTIKLKGNIEVVVIFFKKGFRHFDIELGMSQASDLVIKDDYTYIKDVIWVNNNIGKIEQKAKQGICQKMGFKKAYSVTFM